MTVPPKEIYINSTIAYCTQCDCNEMARIVARKTGVFMERLCPKVGVDTAKIASDYKWYITRTSNPGVVSANKNVRKSQYGCPFDCGFCEWHSGRIRRAIISITNDLNSAGSNITENNNIYTERYKSLSEIERIINSAKEKLDSTEIINLTGDDTLLHPNLLRIIDQCKQVGFKEILLDLDGFSNYEDHDLLTKIKQADVHLVLSINTTDPEENANISRNNINDKKLKILRAIESLQIPTDILLTYDNKANEKDIPFIANKYIKRDFVRNIIIQIKPFKGGGYCGTQSSESILIDDIEKLLSTGGDFSQDDFSFLPSYHSLCYSVAYYIVSNQNVIPLTGIIDKNNLIRLSEKCCQPDADQDFSRNFWDGINRFWSCGKDYDSIKVLKQFIENIYPSGRRLSKAERWKLATKMIKAVFIHRYMDKTNFDIDRVSRCGDVVFDESGKLIPICSHGIIQH